MKRILVTGGTGFIGSALTKRLIKEGHEVIITGTSRENCPEGAIFLPVHLYGIDWTQLCRLDMTFHQAGNNDTLDKDFNQMLRANLYAPIQLFHRALKGGCKKFVYASSTAIYGNSPAPYIESETSLNPLNFYADSKARFEKFALHFGLENEVDCVGLRYCNVYGPGEAHKGRRASMIHQMAQTMLQERRPRLFKDGTQKRDWAYIDDVVEANIRASKFTGVDIFNIGSGKAASFNEIIKVLNKELNLTIEPEYIENPHKEAYQSHTECDVTKAAKLLGFEPKFDIHNGIKEYLKAIK
jgi:ADP-L-glycero-D-manno-heptose 6-epimerase